MSEMVTYTKCDRAKHERYTPKTFFHNAWRHGLETAISAELEQNRKDLTAVADKFHALPVPVRYGSITLYFYANTFELASAAGASAPVAMIAGVVGAGVAGNIYQAADRKRLRRMNEAELATLQWE